MDSYTVYECRVCHERFIKEDWDDRLEEVLWGHIQMEHEDVFETIQDLDTPIMIEMMYNTKTVKSIDI